MTIQRACGSGTARCNEKDRFAKHPSWTHDRLDLATYGENQAGNEIGAIPRVLEGHPAGEPRLLVEIPECVLPIALSICFLERSIKKMMKLSFVRKRRLTHQTSPL
jgi:hypothetical protein